MSDFIKRFSHFIALFSVILAVLVILFGSRIGNLTGSKEKGNKSFGLTKQFEVDDVEETVAYPENKIVNTDDSEMNNSDMDAQSSWDQFKSFMKDFDSKNE